MSKLELKFLGVFNAAQDDASVTGFESNKVRALLVFLAVEAQRPHARESLAAMLWPDWPDTAARSNLRYALADLRKAIRDHDADPPFLLITRDNIQFNPNSDHQLDAAEFTKLASLSGVTGSLDGEIERLCQALALYKGGFLDGFSVPEAAPFEEWARLKREQLHRQHLGMLHDLAAALERGGDIHQALTYAWQQVEIEPWREDGQRQLMRLLALDGQRSAALAQYGAFRRILADELQAEPSFDTMKLYESIRDGTLDFQAGSPSLHEELPPAPGVPPFMGLQYFDERDADLYYGREALTSRLVGHLRDLHGIRTLAVVGASGSGKSSLVRAGLIPAIRRGERLPDGTTPPRWCHRWLLHVITPTAHPLEALATSLTREGGSVSSTAALIDDLGRDPRSLHLYARRMTHLRNSPHLLLVVDQFEELFTLCRSESERQAFIENLLFAAGSEPDMEVPASELVPGKIHGIDPSQNGPLIADQSRQDRPDQGGPVISVIALRADFYNHCSQYAGLRSALSSHQEFIGPMSLAELRRAIEEPAKENDWEFEPGLVDLILREVSDEPGALPLLSHALLETWGRRRGRTLTLKGYAEAGSIHGAIAQTAESVYADLSPERRDLARRIFLRLTELGEGTQDTRRRASVSELASSAEAAPQIEIVLNTLVEARLVTAGEGTVEVAHEALIREWPALRQWLDEDRESLRLHRHLTEATQAWEAMGGDIGELYRGARLAQAIEWSTQQANADALNAQERAFLEASRELEALEAAEREAQRQRELEAAQRATEAERRRAEEQARSAARLRRRALYLVGVVLIALVMAGVAFAFANRSANLAVQNADIARLANTQRALAEAEAAGRATQQAVAESESVARATAEAVAVQEREVAESQTLLTTSREMALAAVNNLEIDPERSILLALQAVSTAKTAGGMVQYEIQDSLHQAVLASRSRMTLRGHSSDVWDLAYSPDGTQLATAGWDGMAIIWNADTGQVLFRLKSQNLTSSSLTLQDIAYSPDGSQLATADAGGFVILWDPKTGERLALLLGHTEGVDKLAFSPDGRLLATASQDQSVSVWDTSTGNELVSVTVGESNIPNVAFSSDGTRLMSVGESIQLWDTETWTELLAFPGTAGAISPDGMRLAIGGADGSLRVVDADSGEEQLTLRGNLSEPIEGILFSPDGSRLVGHEWSNAVVWDANTGQKLFSILSSIGFKAVFTQDSTYLISSSQDGTAKVWDVASGSELFTLAGSGAIYNLALRPDCDNLLGWCEAYLATASRDRTARVWDISPTGSSELLVLPGFSTQFSPDGKYLITAELLDPDTIRFQTRDISPETIGTLVYSSTAKLTAPPVAGDFSRDETRAALLNADASFTVFDLIRGTQVISFPVDQESQLSFSLNSDWTRLATIANDSIQIWDATNGQKLHNLSCCSEITFFTFNPSSKYLAIGEGMGTLATIHLMDASYENDINAWMAHEMPIQGLAFSPDGTRLASASQDMTVKIWRVPSGAELLTLRGHTATVTNSVFSQDGTRLATSSYDGTIKVWDALIGQNQLTLPGNAFMLTFSPDGKYLASGDYWGGLVQVYLLDIDELVELAKSRVTRTLTQDECRQFLHLETCPAVRN